MQGLISDMELLERFWLTHYNYEFMEAQKNEALKAKEDVLAAKGMIEEKLQLTELRLREKEKELEEVKQEVQHEKLRVGELEEATKKWEEEAIRLAIRMKPPKVS